MFLTTALVLGILSGQFLLIGKFNWDSEEVKCSNFTGTVRYSIHTGWIAECKSIN